MNQFIEKTIKEFEEKLLNEWVNQIDYDDIQSAKSFLLQALTDQKKELLGEIEKKILKKIIPKRNNTKCDDMDIMREIDAYNEAIDIIWENYNEIKKEIKL